MQHSCFHWHIFMWILHGNHEIMMWSAATSHQMLVVKLFFIFYQGKRRCTRAPSCCFTYYKTDLNMVMWTQEQYLNCARWHLALLILDIISFMHSGGFAAVQNAAYIHDRQQRHVSADTVIPWTSCVSCLLMLDSQDCLKCLISGVIYCPLC